MTAVVIEPPTPSDVDVAETVLLTGLALSVDGQPEAGRLRAIVVDLSAIAPRAEYAMMIALLSRVARKRGWIK